MNYDNEQKQTSNNQESQNMSSNSNDLFDNRQPSLSLEIEELPDNEINHALTGSGDNDFLESPLNNDKGKNEDEIIKNKNPSDVSDSRDYTENLLGKKRLLKSIVNKQKFDSSNEKVDKKEECNITENKNRQKEKKFNIFSEEIKASKFTNNTVESKIPKQLGLYRQIGNQKTIYELIIKILYKSLRNIVKFINQRIKERFKKIKLKLAYIGIKTLKKLNEDNLEEIFESKILDIISDKYAPTKNKNNKDKIEQLIIMEKEDKKEKVKLLGLYLTRK